MSGTIVALSGGVGGAKLVLGLSKILKPTELFVVANTGDDFEHLGYYICPDIDTLIYTLGGVSNTELGWGRANETWQFMDRLKTERPDDAWFLLGDKDLEMHRLRSKALAKGATLTDVTLELARNFGIDIEIGPMSDDPVRTTVLAETSSGERWLAFQEYFVRLRCEPVVKSIEFHGHEAARLPSKVNAVVQAESTRAIVICPSNPYLSIDPILSVRGMTELLRRSGAPVVAVSPVVGGRALKGPTAKIMRELGLESDVASIAQHYQGLIDGLVIDVQDEHVAATIERGGIPVAVTNTVMKDLDDRVQLAREVLDFAESLS